MRCGGCAAKVPAEVLARAIARLAPASKPDTCRVGLGSPDDAAVVSFPGAPPLLQTVDFFRAMVDDPYLFGRIAANHALGDIYAMGGLPETALAIATLPPSRPAIIEQDLFHMLKGGTEVLEEAGAVLIGGHSAEGAELALGFAVTGRTRPGRLLRKGGLRPGDRLVLTKPLGTGVILAAEMRGRARRASFAAARRGNAAIRRGGFVLSCRAWRDRLHRRDRVRAARALIEMLTASGMAARLDPAAIPALDGAMDLLAGGLTSSLHSGNAAALAALAPDGRRCRPGFRGAADRPADRRRIARRRPGRAGGRLRRRAEPARLPRRRDRRRDRARRGRPLVSLEAGCAADADLAPLAAAGE